MEGDLSTPDPPTKWKELSILYEEQDCMEGLSTSSNMQQPITISN
jgi:hypothetical protein